MEKKILNLLVAFENGEITLMEAHRQLLLLYNVSSSFSSESDHICMMYLDKQKTCMLCGKQNCC